MANIMTLRKYKTLRHRDFGNGAVLDEIRAALAHREQLIKTLIGAQSEVGCCHALFDQAVSLCGYDPRGPYPGLVDAVREQVQLVDFLLAVVRAVHDHGDQCDWCPTDEALACPLNAAASTSVLGVTRRTLLQMASEYEENAARVWDGSRGDEHPT